MSKALDRVSQLVESLINADHREIQEGGGRPEDRLKDPYLQGRISALGEVLDAIDMIQRQYRRGDAWERDDNEQQDAAIAQQEAEERLNDHLSRVDP